jgi:hypothetical protein
VANRREAELVMPMILQGSGPNATRSGINPNPADPRNYATTDQLGQTIGGRQAVLKMLHPCMEHCDLVVKVPDGAVSTSVVMERRDEFVLGNQTPSTTTWNCIVFTNPFLANTQFAIQWTGVTAPTELTLQLAFANMVEKGFALAVYPLWGSFSEAGFAFFGTVMASATLAPVIIDDQSGVTFSGLVKNIRRTYLGSTTDFDAPSLSDQGRVLAGQWNPDVALETKELRMGTPPVLTDVLDYYVIQAPAVTTSSLVQSDAFSREAQAKTGDYLPLRPCAPVFDLTSSTELRRVITNRAGTGDVPADGTEQTDLFLRGWSIAVEIWYGMSVDSQLRIKRREGLELVPAPDSTYGPFATPALPDDVRAKQILEEFCRTQPHAYPADYNDLGQMIPNILGSIADVVGSLGLPLISPAANLIKKVLPTGNGGVAEIVERATPLIAPTSVKENSVDKLAMLLSEILGKK